MQRTVNLLTAKNERVVTNIPESYQNETLRMLKTRYMTCTSYDENNEHTGFNIELCSIDCEKGVAHFEKYKDGYCATHFTMDIDDDPIVVFDDDEPGIEHHIFEKLVDYEINQEIKPGCLYKFQKAFTHEWFIAIVQYVSSTSIYLNKLEILRNESFEPALFKLQQQENTLSIYASDAATVEKFKNYVVTKLCDLTDMFTDNYDVDEDDKNESKN